MKPKAKKDYERRAKDCLKKLILRFQDYEAQHPYDFEVFIKKNDTSRSLKILTSYLND